MPSFMDIVAMPEIVKIDGQDCPVHGVSVDGLGALFQRFPWLLEALLSGNGVKIDLTPEQLIKEAPGAAVAIMAAALGYPGNEEAEAKVRLLPLGPQLEILVKAKKRTMPDGLSPFVESLKRLGVPVPDGLIASGNDGKASTSQKQSSAPRTSTAGQRRKSAGSRRASSQPISGSQPVAPSANAPTS